MKKPDLLILIAIWEFITAFFAFVGIAAIAVFAIPAVTNEWTYRFGDGYRMGMVGGIFGLSIAILVLLFFPALAIAGAIGLLLNKGHEWARIVSIIHSGLSLLVVPIGTVIGTLSIIYLTKPEVRDYFNPPSETPKS
jgi:Ca2+/Na+ antiporter